MQVHVSNDQHIMMATEMQNKHRLMTAKTDMRKDSDFVGRANKLKSQLASRNVQKTHHGVAHLPDHIEGIGERHMAKSVARSHSASPIGTIERANQDRLMHLNRAKLQMRQNFSILMSQHSR